MLRWLLPLVAVCTLILEAGAAHFEVANTLDSGPGTLRQAISDANANTGADTITCTNISGTILLASPFPVLTGQANIVGPGANLLTISGNNAFRVLQIAAGSSVSISGLTIANGYVTNDGGAGIHNSGSLILSNSGVVRNQSLSAPGGGILNRGTLTVISTTVASNLAGVLPQLGYGPGVFEVRGLGGGVYLDGGSVSISSSSVSANQAVGGLSYGSGFPTSGEGSGGGIFVRAGQLTISSSTLSSNVARGGYGGSDPFMGVNGSSGGRGFGGAVFLMSNTSVGLVLVNCTVSGNKAEGGAGGSAFKYGGSGGDAFGGGIFVSSINCSLVNCTVYQNVAAGGAGGSGGTIPPHGPGSRGYGTGSGIYIPAGGASLLNTILQASVGTVNSRGNNIFESGSTISGAVASDITNVLVNLDSLADNGGETFTHALLTYSPAVDAGASAGAPHFDQRGIPRPQGSSVDIGAFESSFQGSSAFITGQPQDLSLLAGANAVFSVAARGTKPLYFQWQFNGTNIGGATNASFAITNIQLANIGHYSVIVSNDFGSAASRAAQLEVTPDTLLNNWVVRQDSKTYGLEAISYGNGLFVAVGHEYATSSYRGIILTSPDGAVWSERFSQLGLYFRDVAFGNGTFIAVSGIDSIYCSCPGIVTSSNGVDWSVRSIPYSSPLYVAGYGGGKFIAAGGNYGGSYFAGSLLTSTNTAGWSVQNLGTIWWKGFAYGDGVFLLVGSSYQGADSILRSTDGISWQSFNPSNPDQSYGSVGDVIYAENQFVAIGYTSSSPYTADILTSDTGMSWSRQAQVTANLNALASGYGIHVAVGRNGAVWSATNVTQWTPHFRNTSSELTDVVAGQGTFVAVGYNGIILQSGAFESFDLTVSVQGQGTVSRSPDMPRYRGGESVSLVATPARSQAFIQWSDGVTSNPRVVIVSEHSAYTAVFTPVPTLDILSPGGGRVSAAPSNSFYLNNTVVGLSATPEAGWSFAQWLGDASGTNTNTTVIMNRDRCVQAVFGTSISNNVIGSGSIVRSPSAELYPYGTRVTLMPVPNTRSYFAQWGDDPSATNNPLTFTVTNASPSFTAVFAARPSNLAALTALPDGFGQVSVSPSANVYAAGSSITLTALPEAGQSFISWNGDASGAQNPLTVTLNSSKVITAQFTKRPTLSVQPCSEPSLEDGFQFLISGEFGARYVIEKSGDGQAWAPLATVTNLFGVTQFNDTTATNAELRMYRAAPALP